MLIAAEAKGTIARMFHENPPAEFTDSLASMLLYSQRFLCSSSEYIHYNHGTLSYHEWGRNQLVDEMRGDWILMLDTDHQFDPDFLERLLNFSKRFNASVVGSTYLRKSEPHAPVVNMWIDEKQMTPVLDIPRDREFLLAGAIGAGGLFIKKEVLDAVKEKFPEGVFTRYGSFSEDFSFCARCRDLGIPVHLAIQIENPHLIRVPLRLQDYEAPEGLDIGVRSGKLALKSKE